MRYSEAVKRYKFETKQRILSNILEAAEKEQTAARLSDNNETENGTNETNKKETIIMKETFFNEVSRRKSGAIAAACAALIIGGSVAAFANSNKLQKDNSSVAVTNSNPGASTVLNSGRPDENSTSTDADETASQDENSVNDAVTPEADSAEASSSDDTSSKNNKKNDSSASANDNNTKKTTVSSGDNTTSSTTDNKKTAAADPDVKASFDELLASTDYVMLGQIVKAEPTTITNRDGSTQYCIAYEIYHEYNYVKNTKQLYFIGGDTTIYQPVAEGTKASLVYGDQAVFMAYDSGNYGMVKTASNGVFAPGKNDLKSVSSGTDSINNAMTDYIFNTVLYGRDRYNVEGWISSLYGSDSYDWTDDIYDENYPFEATFVSWDGSKFILHENTNPTWQTICQKLTDNDGYCYNYETDYPVYTDDPINHDEPIFVSDCDELDIAMTGISLNTRTNAIAFDFSIMPKAGSRIILNDGVFYDLKVNSNKILGDMGKYFNADSIIVSKAQKFSLFPDNCICFTVMLYQSEPNGKLSLDLDRNFSFTLGGIYNADGSALYNSEIKIDFKVDSRVLAEAGDDEVDILPSETADRKILG